MKLPRRMKKVIDIAKDVYRAYRKPLRTDASKRFNFFPLSLEPLVIFTYTGWDLGNVFHMSRELGRRRACFVVGFTRYPRRWHLMYMKRQLRAYMNEFPRNKIAFLANSEEECENMIGVGFEAYQVSNNTFQREDQFALDKNAEKQYDAVINSRLAPWKRIELARDVKNLAIITILDDPDYGEFIRYELRHAYWANFKEGGYSYLSRSEVSTVVNQSRVGLILSALEGNNRASIEYLLCGLPVVSTPSKGGRDVFFDEEYCLIVNSNPGAVRDAVADLVGRNHDPVKIREKTIDKIVDYRHRFSSIVSMLTDGRVVINVSDWLDKYPDNMDFRCSPNNFIKFLDGPYLLDNPFAKSEKSIEMGS